MSRISRNRLIVSHDMAPDSLKRNNGAGGVKFFGVKEADLLMRPVHSETKAETETKKLL